MALDVSAGQRITAALLNRFVSYSAFKAADETRATITKSNDADLTLTLPASRTYRIEAFMAATTANVGNDIATSYATTGTIAIHATGGKMISGPQLSNTTNDATTMKVQGRAALNTSVSFGLTTEADGSFFHEHFLVTTGASGGTITLQWAQVVATSGVTTLKAGSFITAQPVS